LSCAMAGFDGNAKHDRISMIAANACTAGRRLDTGVERFDIKVLFPMAAK